VVVEPSLQDCESLQGCVGTRLVRSLVIKWREVVKWFEDHPFRTVKACRAVWAGGWLRVCLGLAQTVVMLWRGGDQVVIWSGSMRIIPSGLSKPAGLDWAGDWCRVWSWNWHRVRS